MGMISLCYGGPEAARLRAALNIFSGVTPLVGSSRAIMGSIGLVEQGMRVSPVPGIGL